MTTYRVKDWDDNFENNRTRELKHMAWIPMPNKQDGDGYTELVDHKDGAAHLGVWLALVQVASKCDERGTLVRDSGKPHDPQSLSRMTRLPAKTITDAMTRLVSIGWLAVCNGTAEGCDNPAPLCGLPEQKGTEQKEQKEQKHPHGELSKVRLTDDEYKKLQSKHSPEELAAGIEVLDGYIANNPRKYTDHYAVMKADSWVWERVSSNKPRDWNGKQNSQQRPTTRYQLSEQLKALTSIWEHHKANDSYRSQEAQDVKDKMKEVKKQLAFF